jgi:hypothetical protein
VGSGPDLDLDPDVDLDVDPDLDARSSGVAPSPRPFYEGLKDKGP